MRIGIRTSFSESIHRAANVRRSTIEDMEMDHRRLDVAVAQKVQDGSDVVAAFEQVGGKGMPKGVVSGPFGQAGLHHRVPHGFLDERFLRAMASLFP